MKGVYTDSTTQVQFSTQAVQTYTTRTNRQCLETPERQVHASYFIGAKQ